MTKRIESISGTIEFSDGTTQRFLIGDHGWSQWGENYGQESMGEVASLLDAFVGALSDEGHTMREEY